MGKSRAAISKERIEKIEAFYGKTLKEVLNELHNVERLNYNQLFKKLNQDCGLDIDDGFVRWNIKKLGIPTWKADVSKITSERNKKNWADPEYRAKQEERLRSYWDDPEHREKITNMLKSFWDDPAHREHISNLVKEQWKDPEFIERAQGYKEPTEIEIHMASILADLGVSFKFQEVLHLPEKTVIADFLVEQNSIIETLGTYHHADPRKYSIEELGETQKFILKNDIDKNTAYKKNGFRVLYIWEWDLKNREEWVIGMVKQFLGGEEIDTWYR